MKLILVKERAAQSRTSETLSPTCLIELGANWIHGRKLGEQDNPVWKLAEKYQIATTLCDDDDLITYDQHGEANYYDNLQPELAGAQQKAESIGQWAQNNRFPDISLRAALRLGGWNAENDPHRQAVEFYELSYTNALYPERCSLLADAEDTSGEPRSSTTYYGDDRLVHDARGFNHMLTRAAHGFLDEDDSRLLLNTVVIAIEYSDNGVTSL